MAVPPVAVGQPVTAQKINAIINDIQAVSNEGVIWAANRNANGQQLQNLSAMTFISPTNERPTGGAGIADNEINAVGPNVNWGHLRLSAGGRVDYGPKAYIDLQGGAPPEIIFGMGGEEHWKFKGRGSVQLSDILLQGRYAVAAGTSGTEINAAGINGSWGCLRLSAGGSADVANKSFVDVVGGGTGNRVIVLGTAGLDRLIVGDDGLVSVTNDLSISGDVTVAGQVQPKFYVSTSPPPDGSWIWLDIN